MMKLLSTLLFLAFLTFLGACTTNKLPAERISNEEKIEEKTFPEKPDIPDGGIEGINGEIIGEWRELHELDINEFYDRTKKLIDSFRGFDDFDEKEKINKGILLEGYFGLLELREDLKMGAYRELLEMRQKLAPLIDCEIIFMLLRSGLPVSQQSIDACTPKADIHSLTNPLLLPPLEANKRIVPIALEYPQNLLPISSSEVIGDLPKGFSPYGVPLDEYIVLRGVRSSSKIAKDAHSKIFTVRVSKCYDAGGSLMKACVQNPITGQQVAKRHDVDFIVTQPIELGIHRGCDSCGTALTWQLWPNQGIDEVLYASGDEISVSGPFEWAWLDSTLPLALSLAPEKDSQGTETGNLTFIGKLNEGQHSVSGRLRLRQGSQEVYKNTAIEVAVHFLAAERAALQRDFAVDRNESFRLDLPQPYGGDGSNYTWQVIRGSLNALGLQLVQNAGVASLQGTIAANAPIGTHEVELEVSSSIGHSAKLTFSFEISIPFSVWNQNAQLRPNNLLPLTTAEVAALSVFFPPLAIAEGVYDALVPNSFDDNQERTNMMLSHMQRFDIVAFQEVFDEDNVSQFLSGVGSSYNSSFGPPKKAASFNPFNPKLPEGASGLLLFARSSFTMPSSDHQAVVFNDCNGDLADVAAGALTFDALNADCLAQKGFSLDKVQVGSNADEYLYVVNTHLDADAGSQSDAATRSLQFAQIKSFLDSNTNATHPILLMGDLNTRELSNGGSVTSQYNTMLSTLGMIDIFRQRFPNRQTTPGFTSDNTVNAYGFNWNDGAGSPNRQRIDYFLVKQGTRYELTLDDTNARPIFVEDNTSGPSRQFDTRLCRAPGPPVHGWLVDRSSLRCYVSDHWGLVTYLRLTKP